MSNENKRLDYEAIKKAVSVYDVLTKHYDLAESFETIAEGQVYSGPCPICKSSEGVPFLIFTKEERSVWHCLAECNAAGDVLDLVAKMESTDVHESAFLIATWFNLLPEPSENGMGPPALEGKGYLRDLGKELKKLLAKGDDDETIRFVKEKVLESYRNGQRVEKISA